MLPYPFVVKLAAIGALVTSLMVSGTASPEGTHRGIVVHPETNYHMLVVLDDPVRGGKHVSMIDDKTQEECDTAETVLKHHIPDAWVCCYHTADQARGC